MNRRIKEQILNRIISGEIIYRNKYVIRAPTRRSKNCSNVLFEEICVENKFASLLSDEEIPQILIRMGELDSDYKERLEQSYNLLEKLKVDIFKEKINHDKIRRNIRGVERAVDKCESKINYLRTFTLYGFASIIRYQYLIYDNLFYLNSDQKVFSSFNEADSLLLDKIYSFLSKKFISSTQYREIARTEPWRSYWMGGKYNVFGKPIIDWTDEQRNLCSFSTMYDNAYGSYDCPSDDVINDDDRFDGWIIYTRQESENKRKEGELGDRYKKYDKYNEVFVVADSKEDAEKVYSWNSPESIKMKQQRAIAVGKTGSAKEAELPDKQIEINRANIEKFNQHMKGK